MNPGHPFSSPGPRCAGTSGLLAVALLLGACSNSVEPLLTRWEGNLAPLVPDAPFGQAAAVTQFGRTEASVLIQGGMEGLTYGWRIDSGGCQESGTVQGGPAQYPPLVPGEDGSASAVAVLATVFKPKERFSARLFFAEAGGPERILACGELRLIP